MFRRKQPLVVALLLLWALVETLPTPWREVEAGSADAVQAGGEAIVAAFVLPRLSMECVMAVVEAIHTCSSPGPGGAIACGMAAVRILQVCP